MKTKPARTLWLSTQDQALRALLRAALASQEITPLEIPPESLLSGGIRNGAAMPSEGSALLIDLAWAVADAHGSAEVIRRARSLPWQPAVLSISPFARACRSNEKEWARLLTGHDMLARPDISLRESIVGFLAAALPATGAAKLDSGRLETHLRVLVGPALSEAPEALIRRATGGSSLDLAAALASGAEVTDRRYRLKKYPECFVGAEAVGWMCKRYRLGRDDAVSLGDALIRAGHVHHVVKEQPFRDGEFFYRVALPGRFDAVPIAEAVACLRDTKGLVADRTWRGAAFPRCMVGAEAVDALAGHFRLTRAEATTLGQSLADLGLLRHVADEHPFVDGHLYYRIVSGPSARKPGVVAASAVRAG